MTAGAPWSVKGIDPKAREVAKDHARRSGMTLGEWLNRVILDDDGAPAATAAEPDFYAAPPLRAFGEPPARPRLAAETGAPRADELGRIAHALERLTDRLEASETRTGLAISGVEHSVRQAVARIETAERESLAVASRVDTAAERLGGEQARIAERLRRFESEAAGPRSGEALRAIEQSVGRISGQLFEAEAHAREGLAGLETRLSRIEARPGADPAILDDLVQRLGERLAQAESHTADAVDVLRRSLAALDGRLRTIEGARGADDRRFEALAQTLAEQVEAARAQLSERLMAVDADRIDRRFAELAAEVKAAEMRSAQAVQKIGREVLSMADALNRRLQSSEDRNAEAIAQLNGEMARVAGAMEARVGGAEQAQAQALERLSSELGRITDRLSERLLLSERRAAEAIDDLGQQVGRVSERLAQSHERAAQELAEKIRESEERTARLLEETRSTQAPEPEPRPGADPVPAAEPAMPSPAAFGPELFSRAEESEDEDDLDLLEVLPPRSLAAAQFEASDGFAPIPEPEEDLFGLDQPEPPAGAEVNPLSTREVIDQARAAARAEWPGRVEVKAKANWRATGKPSASRGGFLGMRTRRAPGGSTLQTALMVAGGAAFLSVGAAGVVLMQGAPSRPAAEMAAADEAQTPRAAVALAPQAVTGAAPAPGEPAEASHPPAQLADALLTAYAKAAKGVEADEPGALARLKALADAGHAPAQFYLGKLYESGEHGVKQNLAEARRWTERAAQGGDPAAMHNLALFDFRGEGGAQDLAGAARWFRAAAQQGIVDSQYNLGLLYESGSGVERDPVQAYVWFSIAAAGGDAQAAANARELATRLSAQQRAAADQMIGAFSARSGTTAALSGSRMAAAGQ